MKWSKLESKIKDKKFVKYGEFQYDENSRRKYHKIVFKPCKEEKEQLGNRIYLWILIENKDEDESYIIYVGKASKTIKERMDQHRNGFNGKENGGSLSGGKKRKFLEKKLLIEKSNRVEIWARYLSEKERDINTAESSEMTDWKDKKNYWLFLNQELPTEFFE
jgi:hypothetical protein